MYVAMFVGMYEGIEDQQSLLSLCSCVRTECICMFVSKFASSAAVHRGLRYDDQAQLRDPGSPGFFPEHLELAEQLFLSQGEPYR
jgi:hypothetical protein